MGFPKSFLWGVSESGFRFEMGDSAGRNVDVNTNGYVWVHDAENIRREGHCERRHARKRCGLLELVCERP
ncbi:MAG: hypothetical protein QW468_02110 [Candidatus Bathyarchaeia archaeon]